MIKTLTLNPAVDKTVIVEDFKIDQLNRVKQVYQDAGGKGINVSKMLKNLKQASIVAGFIGGTSGLFIKSKLKQLDLLLELTELDSATRTNTKLIDQLNNTFTDINESGQLVSQAKLAELQKKLFDNLEAGDILILAGSIPPGIADNIYHKLIKSAKKKKIKTILDAEGKLFEKAIQAGPGLIKPNEHELASYYGKSFNSLTELIKAAEKLLSNDIEEIMLSLGKKGAVYINQNEKYFIEPLKLAVQSTVGAGDAMVAGLAYGIEKNLNKKTVLKYAAACSSATLIQPGTEMGSKKDVEKLQAEIKIKKLNS